MGYRAALAHISFCSIGSVVAVCCSLVLLLYCVADMIFDEKYVMASVTDSQILLDPVFHEYRLEFQIAIEHNASVASTVGTMNTCEGFSFVQPERWWLYDFYNTQADALAHVNMSAVKLYYHRLGCPVSATLQHAAIRSYDFVMTATLTALPIALLFAVYLVTRCVCVFICRANDRINKHNNGGNDNRYEEVPIVELEDHGKDET